MDLVEHTSFRESDRDPGAPKLSLEISYLNDEWLKPIPRGQIYPPRGQDSKIIPFGILFKVKYERQPEATAPIVIQWNPLDAMRFSQFVLLRKTKDGFQRCDIPKLLFDDENDDFLDSGLEPGTDNPRAHMLSYEYHKIMDPGETYRFFWPGGEVKWWDWGTKEDLNRNRADRAADIENDDRPRLILPASNTLEFTGSAEIQPYPERSGFERLTPIFRVAHMRECLSRKWQGTRARVPTPLCFEESDRVPGAPVLRKKIEGKPVFHAAGQAGQYTTRQYTTTVIMTYVVPAGHKAEEMKPITFLDFGINHFSDHLSQSLWSVLPLSSGGSEALAFSSGYGYPVTEEAEFPDYETPQDDKIGEFDPGTYEFCHTLHPGESVRYSRKVESDEYEEKFRVGETYMYRFNGKVIRWWDWGTKEDHKGKMAKREDMEGSGRPRIVVPAASLDFIVKP